MRPAARGALCLAALLCAAGMHGAAAAHASVGTPVADLMLATAQGGRAQLLARDAVSVLVFFRTGHERSASTLAELARCRAPFSGKPVRWAGIVSSAAPAGDALSAVREARLEVPVLIDEGDALVGRLGVVQHPAVAIVGKDHRLAAFEPYRAVDYCARVTARLRQALGEISESEVRAALEPPRAVEGGEKQVARRYRALAEKLFRAGKHDKALESVRKSLEHDPELAPAHALLGSILSAQGDCDGAADAYRKARELDASLALAREGRCPD